MKCTAPVSGRGKIIFNGAQPVWGCDFLSMRSLGPNGRALVYRPRGSFIQTMKVGGPAPCPLSLMQPCDLKRLKTVRHWGQGRDLRQDKDPPASASSPASQCRYGEG